MKKFEMVKNINDKAKNGRELHSLDYKMIPHQITSSGQDNVTYSKEGLFITTMPGHLMKYRIKATKNKNVFRLYVGNIYINDEYEQGTFDKSGLQITEEQLDRELSFAQGNYRGLTEDEERFLESKLEVYTNIDLVTRDFLLTRNEKHTIVVTGTYNFGDEQYVTKKPGRRGGGNPNWDSITITLNLSTFAQVAPTKGSHFIDISGILNEASFKLRAEKIAEKMGTKVKFIKDDNEFAFFEDESRLTRKASVIKYYKKGSKNDDPVERSQYADALLITLDDVRVQLVKLMPKYQKFGITAGTERKGSFITYSTPQRDRRITSFEYNDEGTMKTIMSEYMGKMEVSFDSLHKDKKAELEALCKEHDYEVPKSLTVHLKGVGHDVRTGLKIDLLAATHYDTNKIKFAIVDKTVDKVDENGQTTQVVEKTLYSNLSGKKNTVGIVFVK